MADVTAAQARILRELRALSSCSRAVMRATDERTLLADVCRIVCDEAGYRMAWVGYPSAGEERAIEPVAWAGVEEGYLGTVGIRWDDPVRGGGPSGIAFRTGSTAVAQDFGTEPALAPWREAALQRGYRSSIALPLRDGERTFGVLCIYSTEPGAFTEEERRLVEELSGDLAFGIVVLRSREGLRFAEQERAAHLHHLESMDRVNRAIVSAADLEVMLSDVLDVVVSVFRCDRAFLLHPCDPDSATWRVPMERCVPEYPGAAALALALPFDPEIAETLRTLLAHGGPVRFGPGCAYPLPGAASERFGFRALLSMAIQPRSGSPWQFGLHQCSGPRDWTADEMLLFQEIGRRLADALSTRLAVRDLAESAERLEKAERMALLGHWEAEAPDWRTTMSTEAMRIFGLPPEPRTFEHPAWHALWRTVVHEDDLERVEPLIAASLAGGPRTAIEYRVVWPGGEVRHVQAQADLVLDEAGRLRRLVGTVQDITDRKRAEEALRSSEAQLRQAQKLEAVGRLAGGVAHDFNNVLTAILGDAQALLDGLGPSDPLRVEAREILDAGQRAALLVRKLLAFGRRQQSEPCAVDLGVALLDLERLLRRLVGEDVEFATVLGPDLGEILVDPVQLEQVILNLVVNARDAMPRGGRLTIEARNAPAPEAGTAGVRGPRVLLAVRDTGTGMGPEVREHLFEPFFTTKEPGKGTGLGLATVYAIVTQAGGSIRVESAPGEGSSFEVSFPRVERGAPRARSSAPAGARGTERVLVVEDEPLVRAHAVRSLRAAGYDVAEASGPEPALALVASGGPPFDLLVTDVVMPRMGGPELAARLRSSRPDLPVLFTSGYTDRAGELRGAPGTDASFLPKPFTPGELSLAVRELLDRRRMGSRPPT